MLSAAPRVTYTARALGGEKGLTPPPTPWSRSSQIMTVTRRSFLRSGALTVIATGIALDSISLAFAQQLRKSDPSQDFQLSLEAQREPTYNFRRETFESYLNGVFTLRAGA